jgi:hypothetical protein
MIKIELSKVNWTQSISLGNNVDGKSVTPTPDRKLWYLGHGVLVEQKGRKDILVPVSQVLQVEPVGEVTPEEWSGSPNFEVGLVEKAGSGEALGEAVVSQVDKAAGEVTASPSGPVAEGIKAFTGVEVRARTEAEVAALGEVAAKQYGSERKKPGPKPKGS